MAGEPQALGLADMSAEEAVAAVSGLQPWYLDAAQAEEQAGKARKSVLGAMQKQRVATPAAQAYPENGGVPPPSTGPTYTADELAAIAEERWGLHPDVVRGAFMARGVTALPYAEAQALAAEYAQYRPPIPGQEEA